jgi:DNA-binding response OmpR family regulator
MSRVLLVEDDQSLGRILTERLEKERLDVSWVQNIAGAEAALEQGGWDLAILDVKLPDGSGFGLARRIKRTTLVPLMFMTAMNSAENRLEGFEIGADEYLPKPFHLKEFILRVRHVLATERVPEVLRAWSRPTAHGRSCRFATRACSSSSSRRRRLSSIDRTSSIASGAARNRQPRVRWTTPSFVSVRRYRMTRAC